MRGERGRRLTRAVLDSSVLVSALVLAATRRPARYCARGRASASSWSSAPADLGGRTRPRAAEFEHYITPDEVADFIDMLRSDAVVHPDAVVIERAPRDPDDDYLVALAKAAAAVLVSSDRDLLEADIGDLEVLSAREFLERLA